MGGNTSDLIILANSDIAPLWLVDILNKMVRTDFKERYQYVEAVLKDLGQRNRLQPLENITANNLGITEAHVNNH